MWPIILKQLVSLGFALIFGTAICCKLRRFYTLIFFQVVLAFIFIVITIWLNFHFGIEYNNQWIFNYYIVAETCILALAGLKHSELSWQNPLKIFIVGGFCIFMLAWVLQIYSSGIYVLANRACIVESVFLAILFFIFLYRSTFDYRGPMLGNPDAWLCVGCIIYFGCSIPILGLLHFLSKADEHLLKKLFNIIRILSNIRYLFTGISFVLLLRQHNNSEKKKQNEYN